MLAAVFGLQSDCLTGPPLNMALCLYIERDKFYRLWWKSRSHTRTHTHTHSCRNKMKFPSCEMQSAPCQTPCQVLFFHMVFLLFFPFCPRQHTSQHNLAQGVSYLEQCYFSDCPHMYAATFQWESDLVQKRIIWYCLQESVWLYILDHSSACL